jgi:hypothetical protein
VIEDEIAMDELCELTKKKNMTLKIVAYRYKQVANDYCIRIFVENIPSFCFLAVGTNWPVHLCW